MKQAESMAKGQREWIPLLDAIRGLAVLGVVLCHSYWASRIALEERLARKQSDKSKATGSIPTGE